MPKLLDADLQDALLIRALLHHLLRSRPALGDTSRRRLLVEMPRLRCCPAAVLVQALQGPLRHLLIMKLGIVQNQETMAGWLHFIEHPGVMPKPAESLLADAGVHLLQASLESRDVIRVARTLLLMPPAGVELVNGPVLNVLEDPVLLGA